MLPQAFRTVIPPLGSVLIALTKNTAIAEAFGVTEATGSSTTWCVTTRARFCALFLGIAVGYVLIVLAIAARRAAGRARGWWSCDEHGVLYDVPGPRAVRRSLIGSADRDRDRGRGRGRLVVLRLQRRGSSTAEKWEPFHGPGHPGAGARQGRAGDAAGRGLAIALALVLGSLLAVGRLAGQRYVRLSATGFIELFRALPLVLLILFFFFRFARRRSAASGRWWSALALYNGSVLAEVFRAGILPCRAGSPRRRPRSGCAGRRRCG